MEKVDVLDYDTVHSKVGNTRVIAGHGRETSTAQKLLLGGSRICHPKPPSK